MPVNFTPNDRGLFGYESSHDVSVWINGEFLRIAIVACGGGSANGTMMVDMSGQGCSLVSDWRAVYATMQDLDARITRVDTALDLLEGYDLEYFDGLYRDGQFNCGGRIPGRRYYESGNSHDLHSNGRTMYLGKKVNGKELCIYEKGKQLGNPDSEWVRVEIRFGCRDRVIPHDVVLDPTKYFCGAFVALQGLVDAVGEKIVTDKADVVQEEYGIAMRRLVHYMKASYGHVLHLLKQDFKDDLAAMIDSIAVPGVPRRLHKAVVARRANMAAGEIEQRCAA
jgi:phage replication initiation protein